MNLLISITISMVIAFLLLLFGPFWGTFLGFSIIAGCLIRVLYLLAEIRKNLQAINSGQTRTEPDAYLKETSQTAGEKLIVQKKA
ncbi:MULTISPECIES: hypothetical protein [Evansella]|jgi:membrane protein implicated in regulation of membrane protease activity|uniref:hypothetical protein n=1 Tax=Evansella TaxID=2837485 RepID=UPI0009980242|nr:MULTISPECIES: hypothetical protein [Evansella]UTR10495.1 hypothetical protein MM300_21930 [Evansella sp. LMS18]